MKTVVERSEKRRNGPARTRTGMIARIKGDAIRAAVDGAPMLTVRTRNGDAEADGRIAGAKARPKTSARAAPSAI